MVSETDFLAEIKKVQARYPELNRHQMDGYRCRYYGEIIDLYHAYTDCLEREIRKLRSR